MNGKGAHSMGKGSFSGNTLCYCVTLTDIITISFWQFLSIMQIIQKYWCEKKNQKIISKKNQHNKSNKQLNVLGA
jgi:hypothetical protein